MANSRRGRDPGKTSTSTADTSRNVGIAGRDPNSRVRTKSSTTGLKPGDTPGVTGETTPNTFAPPDSYGTVNPNQDMSGQGEYEQWFQQNEKKFGQQGLGDKFFQRTGEGYEQEGLGEKFAQDNAAALQQAGQGEQWWNKYGGSFNQPGASEQLQQDPGLGAYYDRAKTRTAGSINDQLAARGGFGSSAGMAQISDAMVGLEAERSNKEADYRAGIAGQADEARMTRLGLGGAFAGQAQDRAQGRIGQGMGMASQGQNQMLDRLMAGQNAAGGVDNSRLNQLIAGGNAAMGSQNIRTNRVQAGLDNRIRTGDIAAGVVGGGLQGVADNDQKMFEAMESLGMGGAAQNMNWSAWDAAIASNDQDAVFALLSEAAAAGGSAAAGGAGGSRANAPAQGAPAQAQVYTAPDMGRP